MDDSQRDAQAIRIEVESVQIETVALVYVDRLASWPASERWTRGKSCHLFVDIDTPLERLIQFGATIGMKREWLQISRSGVPHFDLDAPRRELAVAMGAVEISFQKTAEIVRLYRRLKAKD